MHISILLFDDVDLLDCGGPYEVFLTANRLAERTQEDRPEPSTSPEFSPAPTCSM